MTTGRTVRREIPRVAVDAIRSDISIAAVVARSVTLKRSGRDLEGLCPFHDERTPSFKVNDDRGSYHCFGCGAHGDVVSFVMATQNLEFLDAVRALAAGDLPRVDPDIRRAALLKDDTERLAKIADAQALWATSAPGDHTLAGTYARSRGIIAPLPRSIRFARTWAWKDYETGKTGPALPALIGAVQDVSGKVVGVQRVFLNADGTGKADMRNPKRSLGHLSSCALRLGPPAAHVIVIEGPEDGLSVAQALPDVSVWVACGTAMMPLMAFPEVVKTITLAGDNNAPGRFAVAAACAAFSAKGLDVRTMFPAPTFADFNDELRGIQA